MSLSECYFVHAGKYGKPVDRVPARENLPTTEVEAASNHKLDVYRTRSSRCSRNKQNNMQKSQQISM